ncbi:hypothetical protein SCA6_007663 [Theobroma cacao]
MVHKQRWILCIREVQLHAPRPGIFSGKSIHLLIRNFGHHIHGHLIVIFHDSGPGPGRTVRVKISTAMMLYFEEMRNTR